MGPEQDLLSQAHTALEALKGKAPVFYEGHPHKASYPYMTVDLSNVQNQWHAYKGIERTKLTISVDVYTAMTDTVTRLELNNDVRNIMEKVRCAHWWSTFDDYSVRTLTDTEESGQSFKRIAFLFDYITQGIAKKGSN